TAFWELYYSDSILDTEKYLVNADFLKWEEENFDMLRNAKVIGGTPAKTATLAAGNGINGANPATGEQNAYGFSCFNNAGDEGIISMRNPAYSDKTIEFTLDNAIGCTSEGEYKVALDHVYTEGDREAAEAPKTVTKGNKVSMTLNPGETQIWHLTKKGDTEAPALNRLYAENNTTLRVQTNEHVKNAAFEVTVDGKKVDAKVAKAYADLMTFDITLAEAPADGAKVEVKATAGEDYTGNKLTASIARDFHIDGVVARAANVSTETIAASDASFEGPNGFTVTATAPVATDTVLVSQGDQWSLGVNAEGKAVFTVNGATAASEDVVAGTATITGVRENNGMLKVYVNGVLSGSQYDAQKVANYSVKQADITAKAGIAEVVVYDKTLSYDEVPASPLENLINTVEALKDKVTAESWTAANMDALLAAAKEALKGTDAAAQQKAYDELLAGYNKLVPGVGEAKMVNRALNKEASAAWKSDNSNAAGNNDMPINKAVDGVKNTTQQYGEFGDDNRAESSYLQVDLGAVQNVTSINLYRYYQDSRTYPNTTIVLSKDKTFDENDVIVYNSDAENKNGFGAGKDQAYAETSAGKTFEVKAGTQARYVRVYMNGNQRANATGNTNHIVELEVMGPEKVTLDDPFGIDGLEALIARGKTAVENAGKYTPESIDALKTKLAAAETLAEKVRKEIESGKFETTYGEFNTTRDELQAALNNLVTAEPEPEVDKSALQAKYDEVKGLKADGYTADSWKAFAAARDTAKRILDSDKAGQADVDLALQ
ncbi:discoidin domain-containing protein, partial [Collinsella sp. D33t1_170424_A12]|uniref:discoidin domain-containing protein n=1 Tax=Collinsella sp. D33t1_170424_A12 TaxID=2787135 RepID=UPI00189A78B1